MRPYKKRILRQHSAISNVMETEIDTPTKPEDVQTATPDPTDLGDAKNRKPPRKKVSFKHFRHHDIKIFSPTEYRSTPLLKGADLNANSVRRVEVTKEAITESIVNTLTGSGGMLHKRLTEENNNTTLQNQNSMGKHQLPPVISAQPTGRRQSFEKAIHSIKLIQKEAESPAPSIQVPQQPNEPMEIQADMSQISAKRKNSGTVPVDLSKKTPTSIYQHNQRPPVSPLDNDRFREMHISTKQFYEQPMLNTNQSYTEPISERMVKISEANKWLLLMEHQMQQPFSVESLKLMSTLYLRLHKIQVDLSLPENVRLRSYQLMMDASKLVSIKLKEDLNTPLEGNQVMSLLSLKEANVYKQHLQSNLEEIEHYRNLAIRSSYNMYYPPMQQPIYPISFPHPGDNGRPVTYPPTRHPVPAHFYEFPHGSTNNNNNNNVFRPHGSQKPEPQTVPKGVLKRSIPHPKRSILQYSRTEPMEIVQNQEIRRTLEPPQMPVRTQLEIPPLMVSKQTVPGQQVPKKAMIVTDKSMQITKESTQPRTILDKPEVRMSVITSLSPIVKDQFEPNEGEFQTWLEKLKKNEKLKKEFLQKMGIYKLEQHPRNDCIEIIDISDDESNNDVSTEPIVITAVHNQPIEIKTEPIQIVIESPTIEKDKLPLMYSPEIEPISPVNQVEFRFPTPTKVVPAVQQKRKTPTNIPISKPPDESKRRKSLDYPEAPKSPRLAPNGKLCYIRESHIFLRYFDDTQVELFVRNLSLQDEEILRTTGIIDPEKLTKPSNHLQERLSKTEIVRLPKDVEFSTKEDLPDVEEFVQECNLVQEYVPKDFADFYMYVTGFQIIKNNDPVSLKTFLTMYNTNRITGLLKQYLQRLDEDHSTGKKKI